MSRRYRGKACFSGRQFGAEGRRVDQPAAFGSLAPRQGLQRLALIVAFEAAGPLVGVAEAAVIGRFTKHDGKLFPGLLQPKMSLAHQRAAYAGSMERWLDRQRRQRNCRMTHAVAFD